MNLYPNCVKEELLVTTFEDVISKAKSVAEAAGKKTSDFIEVTKLKLEIAETEKEMASVFEGMGRLIYDAKKTGEDAGSLVDDCILKADECQSKIDRLRRKVDEFKHSVRCENCDTANADDAIYCKKCGQRIR